MKVLRKRFGYSYVVTDDIVEQSVLWAFCSGKSIWWNMFLGWRRSKTTADGEIAYFWIPTKKLDELQACVKLIVDKHDHM